MESGDMLRRPSIQTKILLLLQSVILNWFLIDANQNYVFDLSRLFFLYKIFYMEFV